MAERTVHHSGVFMTPQEFEEMAQLYRLATGPVMVFGDCCPAEDARAKFFERIDELAAVHGLPVIEGHYGLTNEGEFLDG